jgi:hypothetical protein
MALEEFNFMEKTLRAQYLTEGMAQSTVATVIENRLYYENEKGVILHKKMIDILKECRTIFLINKKIYNKFNLWLGGHQKIIDELMIKWCPLMHVHCLGKRDYDHLSRYFATAVMDYIGNFSTIFPSWDEQQLTEKEYKVKEFLNVMVMQQLLLLKKQIVLKQQYEKGFIEEAELFLRQKINESTQYRLYFLIPLLSYDEQSLLEYFCEKNNIPIKFESYHCKIAAITFNSCTTNAFRIFLPDCI